MTVVKDSWILMFRCLVQDGHKSDESGTCKWISFVSRYRTHSRLLCSHSYVICSLMLIDPNSPCREVPCKVERRTCVTWYLMHWLCTDQDRTLSVCMSNSQTQDSKILFF